MRFGIFASRNKLFPELMLAWQLEVLLHLCDGNFGDLVLEAGGLGAGRLVCASHLCYLSSVLPLAALKCRTLFWLSELSCGRCLGRGATEVHTVLNPKSSALSQHASQGSNT